MRQPEQLTDDQRRAIEWLKQRSSGILWADVGTGKTVSMLTALKWLIDGFDSRRVLVIGPRLVAERVWSSEVEEWSHLKGLTVSRIVGTPKARLAAMSVRADIYTLTRDNVPWLEEQFIRITGVSTSGDPQRAQYRLWPWDTVILDECQSFKHQDSARFRSMRRLRRLFDRLYLLTGSLRPNGYGDLWAQMYLVDGGRRLGTSESAYRRRWFEKTVNDGVVTWDVRSEECKAHIDRLISEVVLVMRDTQKPVPVNLVEIDLDREELALYNRMVRDAAIEVCGRQITAANAGVLWGKLLQMANGAVYSKEDDEGAREWHLIHDKKVEALVELLESLDGPVIVGYGFKHDLERIMSTLRKRGFKSVSVLRTSKSLDLWREGKIRIGIMHPQSAGHGLNDLYVSGAENLIWFGFSPNREFYDQLNGRLTGGHRRAGRNVVIHHLVVKKTADEIAVRMLDFKGEDQLRTQIAIAKRSLEVANGDESPKRTEIDTRGTPSGDCRGQDDKIMSLALRRQRDVSRAQPGVGRPSDWEAARRSP